MNAASLVLLAVLGQAAHEPEAPRVPGAPASTRRPDGAPASASPEAREAWELFLRGTYGAVERDPVSAMRFDVEVLQRRDAGSNEAHVSLWFLAPRYLRMRTSSGREQGLGPRAGGGSRYWFREDDAVQDLVGRDYATDREQIDQLVALCRNFLALANPARLELARLEELRRGPPAPENRHLSRKLRWIVLESPDFHLPGARPARPGEAPTLYEVQLGLDPETGVARQAQVREVTGERSASAAPIFLAFGRHEVVSGLQVPAEIRLYEVSAGGARGRVEYDPSAAVEIYVLSGDLRPELGPDDFQP